MMQVILQALPYLLRGTLVTLQIAFFSSLLGFIGGTLLGFVHSSKNFFFEKFCYRVRNAVSRNTHVNSNSVFLLPSAYLRYRTFIICDGNYCNWVK